MPRHGTQYSQRSASPHAEGGRASSFTTPISKNTGQRRSWISDVREMTPERASELLSTYCLVRLEKNRPTAEEDELGHAAPWERIQPVMYASLAHETIGMMLGQADEEFGTDLPARRARYLPALNKQIDMVTNHLRDEEEDERFVWTLLQIKEHLKPLDKPAKGVPDKEYQPQRRGSSRKSAKASSASSKTKAKRVSERVAVSLYYLRAPGPNEDPIKLYEGLKSSKEKSKSKKETPPASVPQTSVSHDSTTDREWAPPVPNATRPPPPAQPFVQPYEPPYYTTVPVPTVPTPVYPQPGPQPVRPIYADQYAEYQQVNPGPRQRPTRETLPIRSHPDQSQPPATPSRQDNIPPPPPPVPTNKPTFSYDGQSSWIPPGIEIIQEGDAGEGPSLTRIPRRR
ncbi:hypothetical protein NLG97_g9836 [Lecanicillium saksenae]|uniref:Uncharacterized protein n=1 Tax=Lecanicillium saksenae TaxID=468837 RepID=A0ACC1QF51_9HYPO|nr:hypothetical protein NLG97_g9836 [Lecanicillium saksenae]